jgi:ABC-type polysaccharide/polyol phosphate export permease
MLVSNGGEERHKGALSLSGFFRSLWAYREYLKQSVLRDLRTKYKRSALGYAWTMLHPLAMMAILAVVFSQIMKIPAKDYAVFLLAGLLPWNYFNSTVVMSLGSVRTNARLFGQVPVPKYVFIVSIAFSNLVNLFLALIPLLAVTLVMGRGIPWTVIAYPAVLLPIFFTTLGVAMMLATSNVFFEDTRHLAEVGLQALYFLSPVLYGRAHLPEKIMQYLSFNPLFRQIEMVRGVVYEGVLPGAAGYVVVLLLSAIVLSVGLWIFERAEDKFLYFI